MQVLMTKEKAIEIIYCVLYQKDEVYGMVDLDGALQLAVEALRGAIRLNLTLPSELK